MTVLVTTAISDTGIYQVGLGAPECIQRTFEIAPIDAELVIAIVRRWRRAATGPGRLSRPNIMMVRAAIVKHSRHRSSTDVIEATTRSSHPSGQRRMSAREAAAYRKGHGYLREGEREIGRLQLAAAIGEFYLGRKARVPSEEDLAALLLRCA